jgi:integrase
MPLKIVKRPNRHNALTISGTVHLPDGRSIRVQRRAASDNMKLAQEEAAAIEADLLRTAWHGERRGTRSFASAVTAYMEDQQRTEGTARRLHRILSVIGDTSLAAISPDTVIELRQKLLRAGAQPVTIEREISTPLRSVMRLAAERRWCDPVKLTIQRAAKGRTLFMLPAEAERLIEHAAPHLQPLLIFLLCTGARASEALELEWRDVDLVDGRVTFWKTKSGEPRKALLPARAVAALSALEPRDGLVFRTAAGVPYADNGRQYGGQFKTGFKGAVRRAGLDPAISPHTCRHSWASWFYALHRDPLKLKLEGGWASLSQVERYAHLCPAGHEEGIRGFLLV